MKSMFSHNHFIATGGSLLEYWRFHSSNGILAAGRRSNLDSGLRASWKDSSSSSSFSLGFFLLPALLLGLFLFFPFLGRWVVLFSSLTEHKVASDGLDIGLVNNCGEPTSEGKYSLRKVGSKTSLKPLCRVVMAEISARVTSSPTI